MKNMIISAAAGLLLAGCTSTENGSVRQNSEGTRVYGLDDQPESSIAGEGTLMPGVYDARQLQTGQFTGQERTADKVGPRTVLPRETDARQMDHSAPISLGAEAGALGQTVLQPRRNSVSGSAVVEAPLNPALQPSSSDIYRPSPAPPAAGVGSAPGIESATSNTTTNNPTVPIRIGDAP